MICGQISNKFNIPIGHGKYIYIYMPSHGLRISDFCLIFAFLLCECAYFTYECVTDVLNIRYMKLVCTRLYAYEIHGNVDVLRLRIVTVRICNVDNLV